MLLSLLGTFGSWGSTILEGLLRAWEIFWQSDASVAFMAGACFVLVLILILGIAERGAESDMVQALIASGYIPQTPQSSHQTPTVHREPQASEEASGEVDPGLTPSPGPVPSEVTTTPAREVKTSKVDRKPISGPPEEPVEAEAPAQQEEISTPVNLNIPGQNRVVEDELGILERVKGLPVKLVQLIKSGGDDESEKGGISTEA